MKRLNVGLAFHVHHDVLIEWCYDLQGRIAGIKAAKPVAEQPTRLRLIAIVPNDQLPDTPQKEPMIRARAAYDEAWAAHDEARAAHDEARAAYDKARTAYAKARAAYLASIDAEALHRQVCVPDCPWDGRTLFPTIQEVQP